MLPGAFPSRGFPDRAWPEGGWPGYGGGTPPIPPTPHHKYPLGGGKPFMVVFDRERKLLEDDEEAILIASNLL